MHVWESVIDFTSTLLAIIIATATFQFGDVRVLVSEVAASLTPKPVQVEPQIVYPLTEIEAMKIAKTRGFHIGSNPYFGAGTVYFGQASSTGPGDAWFLEQESFKTETDNCPERTNARNIKIEVNADTGVIDVKQYCFYTTVDW